MAKKLKLIFTHAGNAAVWDEDCKEIFRESWVLVYVKMLQEKGFHPEDLDVLMPNGEKVKLLPLGNGEYHWEFQ